MQSGYYSNARKEIAPLLPKFVNSVLELGCGEGNTLEWLRNTLSVKHCVGVELNRAAAVSARNKGLVVHNVNVEEEALPLTGEQFDLLLCLDVLEHLREPWRVLPVLLAHLRPGGSVIVSIPNVAHVSALLPLIFQNEWQYQDSGILDITHLRFFTGKSASLMLESSGLKIENVLSRFGRKTHRRANFLTFGLFRRFLTLQYLIHATKDVTEGGSSRPTGLLGLSGS